jgi:hypothetical protein
MWEMSEPLKEVKTEVLFCGSSEEIDIWGPLQSDARDNGWRKGQ